jgi:diguanylate cyclase (GGDEF)-like protein
VSNQIKLKGVQDQLAELAATDSLTGLANRRRFDEMLAYEFSRHARSGTELSIILLDIDHFKAYNDTYGHICGDDCLREVARAIGGSVVRHTDLVARYGGEEFILLLPETNLQSANMLAEKIQKSINDLALPHSHSAVADHITASLGIVSSRCVPGGSATDIVTQADQQLYAAKASGRNRSCSAIAA